MYEETFHLKYCFRTKKQRLEQMKSDNTFMDKEIQHPKDVNSP